MPSVSAGSPGTILGLDGDGDPVVATVDGAVRLSLEKAPTMTVGQKFLGQKTKKKKVGKRWGNIELIKNPKRFH